MNAEDLHPQTREKFWCDEHDMVMVKNMQGNPICPFCEADY